MYSLTDLNFELIDLNQNKSRFLYDEDGNLIQRVTGNGITANYQFNGAGLLTKVVNIKSSGDVLSSYSYQYDENGNWTEVTDQTGKTIQYAYDSLDQLLRETDPLSNNTIWYTYDDRGNRTKKEVKDSDGNVISTSTYTYDAANQMTAVNDQVYTYDDNGNLLDDGTNKYFWDADDRLVEVRRKSDNSLIAQYEYDADGRRVKSVVNGVVTNYHYDGGSIRVLYETDANGNPTVLYTYGNNGMLLSMTQVGQGTYYYQYNGRGDVVQLTDQSGNVVAAYTYDAWGNIVESTGSMAESNPYRYAGYRYDSETGLYYLMARYYNPKNGTFLSVDPMVDGSYLDAYTYVDNNPVMSVDPDGNWVLNTIFLLMDIREFIKSPSLAGAGWIALSIASYADPTGALSSAAHAGKIAKLAKALGKARKLAKGKKRAKVGGCNCFTAGTKVLTDEGEKNIEDIEVGDKVLSKDEFNPDGKLAYKEVTALYRNQRDDIIKLHVGEQVIETTDNHPFWVEGKGWVFADELQAGDKLQKADGSNLTIDKVEFVKLDEPVTVYNFTVADFHTYYVTDLGIWVHNTNCNLASPKRTNHILYGDKSGGGHMWPGAPGKSVFPKSWDADKIMNNVSDIVTDPSLNWKKGRVVNGVQRYEVIGVRDGVKIKVITDGKDIITAYPIK